MCTVTLYLSVQLVVPEKYGFQTRIKVWIINWQHCKYWKLCINVNADG